MTPPLGLLTLAALLPPEWELRLADLNARNLTEPDWQWADLILISAMYIQKDGLLDLVKEAKQRGKTVVAGGPYPTSLPEVTLAAGCDYVVRGEGENTIPLLLEAMQAGRTGVIETADKPDLITSPIPRFDLLQLDDYATFSIQTSRGCPFDCEFCDVVNLFGRQPRHKTPKQVVAELETLYRLGATGNVFFCDDNFIGSKKRAQALLHEIIAWSKSRGNPYRFLTQASVNLGQDQEMIELMLEANLREVFIGIESPDETVLETSHKYHNIKNPLIESLHNLKRAGMEVIGSFILGMDGETAGAGKRICAFIEQTDLPVTMLGVLLAAPHTKLWHRLEKEGRLHQDVGEDLGTFSAMNFEPSRPEAEIMQEYVDAWNFLYEPSRYLARTYRYYLAMRPAPRNPERAAGGPRRPDQVPRRKIPWGYLLNQTRSLGKILWWQGIRPPYRRQFWTQMIGMLWHNPTRFLQYFVTCVEGEDLFDISKIVGEKAAAIMKERHLAPPAGNVDGKPVAAHREDATGRGSVPGRLGCPASRTTPGAGS